MITIRGGAASLIAGGLLLAPVPSLAQCPTADCDPALLARRILDAPRLLGSPPVIDGRLDEPVWETASRATGFVQSRPRPAAPATLPSEARVMVDEEALYVGLRYFDPDPAKIQAPLARRDDETTSDWAFVEIDSRHDRRTGFSFGINPRGLQVDGLWLSDTVYDPSWNAVWEGAAHTDERGWTAEFRIPFSQLAFSLPPGAEELTWGINFYRYNPSRGESSNWSPRYSSLGGIVSNFNDLRVPAPARVRRFEVTPYFYFVRLTSGPGTSVWTKARSGRNEKGGRLFPVIARPPSTAK
ncbi:MAG TPA: carbohydrate binding family 9 domain-containing protein, partial [Thermoanaerobaculia bacterium]|nr:carbohydrate binding family 9 domain-containing protein [Thermoanaerobaculia bacterium]